MSMSTAKISKEIFRLTAIKNERIIKALGARADLALAEGPAGRQFILASYYEGKEYITPGVVYALPHEEGKGERETVRVQDYSVPHLYSRYATMEDLFEYLKKENVPFVVKFFDEDEAA